MLRTIVAGAVSLTVVLSGPGAQAAQGRNTAAAIGGGAGLLLGLLAGSMGRSEERPAPAPQPPQPVVVMPPAPYPMVPYYPWPSPDCFPVMDPRTGAMMVVCR